MTLIKQHPRSFRRYQAQPLAARRALVPRIYRWVLISHRQAIRGSGLGILSILVVLSGCTYYQVKKLPPDEQAEFRYYSKVMSAPQMSAYLSQATPAERAAYLEQIGVTQRFEVLDSEDRKAVQAGYIRKGMSANALHFLWGPSTKTSGYTDHYEHWYYYGSVPTLAAEGSQWYEAGTLVDVYLVDSQVKWWQETVPPEVDNDNDSEGFRR
jgi:hypothetical protein